MTFYFQNPRQTPDDIMRPPGRGNFGPPQIPDRAHQTLRYQLNNILNAAMGAGASDQWARRNQTFNKALVLGGLLGMAHPGSSGAKVAGRAAAKAPKKLAQSNQMPRGSYKWTTDNQSAVRNWAGLRPSGPVRTDYVNFMKSAEKRNIPMWLAKSMEKVSGNTSGQRFSNINDAYKHLKDLPVDEWDEWLGKFANSKGLDAAFELDLEEVLKYMVKNVNDPKFAMLKLKYL